VSAPTQLMVVDDRLQLHTIRCSTCAAAAVHTEPAYTAEAMLLADHGWTTAVRHGHTPGGIGWQDRSWWCGACRPAR
jgi:hypothetical protein